MHPVVWAIAALGVGLLIIDHWAHVFGLLPYLVLLACPLMHLLHKGHGHRHGKDESHRTDSSPPPSGG